MKLVSYTHQNEMLLGIYQNGQIWSLQALDSSLPNNMRDFLMGGESMMTAALKLDQALKSNPNLGVAINESEVKLEAPVPNPSSCRDGYAFRQHVAAARRNRGVPMIPEFDQYPIFYFTNHNAIQGPG